MRRETSYAGISLKGLGTEEVGQLLESLLASDMGNDEPLPQQRAGVDDTTAIAAISAQTHGSPFLIREVIHHLVEGNDLERSGRGWVLKRPLIQAGVPAGVRQLIELRLKRLSAHGRRLLQVASGFHGPFRCEIAASVAEMDDETALDAVDDAIHAQLLRAAAGTDAYDFSHDLIRQSIYAGLNPSRQVRLHRQIAEAMERVHGTDAERYAGEIARQYYQSAGLPGAERGVAYCLVAADRAEHTAAPEQVADALAMALALLPADDARRGRVLARRGLALGATKRASEAAAIAIEAAEVIAASDATAAADYLAAVANVNVIAGTSQAAWAVARYGLTFAEGRRDWTWATLRAHDLDHMDAEDSGHPGILVDTAERREIAQLYAAFERDQGLTRGSTALWWTKWNIFESRRAALETAGPSRLSAQIFWAGAYRDALPLVERRADECLARGEVARAASDVAWCSRLRAALGDLAAAEQELIRLAKLAKRTDKPPYVVNVRGMALFDVAYSRGTGLELASAADGFLARDDPGMRYLRAAKHAIAAVFFTFAGRDDDALRAVAGAMPAVERAGGGVFTYTSLICRCCQALWRLARTDFADVLERNLLAKTIAGDFREPGVDARLAMAQLCALTGRPSEAHDWFEQARAVLDEQGARPLRAIVDYDEALMYARGSADGDRERAALLFDAALAQFRAIGMPGWIQRAEHLLATGTEWSPSVHATPWIVPINGLFDITRSSRTFPALPSEP